ncbi:MAG: hypothetical protein ACYTJ0_14685 [Planctomycetota bacterium]
MVGSTVRLGTVHVPVDAAAGAAFAGAVVGLHATITAMPCLWHRSLAASLLVATVPACVASFALGLLATALGGSLLGLVILILAPIVAWRRLPFVYPRHPPGHCPKCGYSLHSLRRATCPECGSRVLSDSDIVT